MKADLHVHTTASDGTLTPAQLVARARDRGVDVLAIADHDTVAGIPEAANAASAASITLVPAVELSAVADGRDAHILGYFVDVADADLLSHLADLRDARSRRAETMVSALRDAGYDISLDDVLALSAGGAVGRSHIARALVGRGHAESVRDAFERLIGHGRAFYVPKDVRTPAEIIGIIRAAGGLPVLAHPGVSRLESAIPSLLETGLGGIEAYHADHSPEQRELFANTAKEAGLLVTGGTDFHGPHAPNPDVGACDVPEDAVSALLAWGAARR